MILIILSEQKKRLKGWGAFEGLNKKIKEALIERWC